MDRLKRPLRWLVALLFRRVLYSHVYTYAPGRAAAPALPLDRTVLPDGRVRYALRESDELLCECYFVAGDAYRDRFPWKLGARDAVLVRLLTTPAARGRGLAPRLVAAASASMTSGGVGALYAMVWHNNGPSKRAFRKAGWRPIAHHLTVGLRGRRRLYDLVWRTRSRQA